MKQKEITLSFSSSDIELLTGIKSATLRMWERRHQILSPTKGNRNIRKYNLLEFKKILNIAFLKQKGYKISNIAAMSEAVLSTTVKELVEQSIGRDEILLQLKLSMYGFAPEKFHAIHSKLTTNYNFTDVFIQYYIPLLELIGYLWQSDAISPIHEHFISNLITQNIHYETAIVKSSSQSGETFILFLNEDEVHEIGLLFIQFLLKKQGHKVIYLGKNTWIEDILPIIDLYPNSHLISHFTLSPNDDVTSRILSFLHNHSELFKQFWGIGNLNINAAIKTNNLLVFENISKILPLI